MKSNYGHSRSVLISPRTLSPSEISRRTGSIADLASPETLRATLGLSRHESYWQLLHTPNRLAASQSNITSPVTGNPQKARLEVPVSSLFSPVTALDAAQVSTRPGSRLAQSQPRKNRERSFPTDRDYRRLLNRLDRIINGSALSFRFTTLSESRPAELSLDTDERQYIRVKTEGLSTPMKVTIARSKGKVMVYLSKSFQEPDNRNCEEVHSRDSFAFSEPGLRFKAACVYLGVHCLEEAALVVTVSFGHRRKALHASATKLPSLTDLGEFRKDDSKRQALSKHVEELLASKQEANKTTSRDYIRENRANLGKDETGIAKKDLEMQRREEALRKHFQNLKDKKAKALLLLRRQELRIEAEAKARTELEARVQQEALQKQWLGLLPFFSSVEVMWEIYIRRKARVEEAGRQVKAAMVLQRCYRRVLLQINPKRLIRQHALHHLSIYSRVIGPEIAYESRGKVANMIRDSAEASRVKDALDAYYRKSTL